MAIRPLVLVALATLALPLVLAAPNLQSGEQTGVAWSDATAVAVQPNTRFVLVGALGDHDVFFYNAAGVPVGSFIACGADTGIVPRLAAYAIISAWDHIGQAIPSCLAFIDPLPSSRFVYVDGI